MKNKIFSFFYKSWWVIAFSIICGIFYENGLKNREMTYRQLKEQLHQLQNEKTYGLELQKSLMQQINSHTDYAWQELILIRVLGLVPENEQKVFFSSNEFENRS